jgi:hypothetical protein
VRGRLIAYSRYHLRDYLAGPGLAVIALVLAVGVFPMWVFGMMIASAGGGAGDVQRQIARLFDTLVSVLATLGPIIGVGGIVSSDRHPGLARFLFARPINVSAYYFQAWVVRGLAHIALTAVLCSITDAWLVNVPWREAIIVVSIGWVLIGGIGLLSSVLLQRDAAGTGVVFVVPLLLYALASSGSRWHGLNRVLTVLPPTHRLEELRRALLTHGAVDQGLVVHALAFGTACVALALILVRRIRLVR